MSSSRGLRFFSKSWRRFLYLIHVHALLQPDEDVFEFFHKQDLLRACLLSSIASDQCQRKKLPTSPARNSSARRDRPFVVTSGVSKHVAVVCVAIIPGSMPRIEECRESCDDELKRDNIVLPHVSHDPFTCAFPLRIRRRARSRKWWRGVLEFAGLRSRNSGAPASGRGRQSAREEGVLRKLAGEESTASSHSSSDSSVAHTLIRGGKHEKTGPFFHTDCSRVTHRELSSPRWDETPRWRHELFD